MPALIRAKVSYRLTKNGVMTSHTWELNMSDAYAGRTESSILAKLQKKHPHKNVVITDIIWR